MKTEMRRALAHELFEEKIRKVGQLIHLSASVKSQRDRFQLTPLFRRSNAKEGRSSRSLNEG